MVLMNLLAGQQWRHRNRKQTCGHSGTRRRWEELRIAGKIHIAIRKIDRVRVRLGLGLGGNVLTESSTQCSGTT